MGDFNDITSWVGIIVFLGGLYCLYACLQMKLKGIINVDILLNKESRYKKCKDEEGYIREMFPIFFIFSITTTLCGAIDLINTFVVDIQIAYLVSLVLFIVGFVLFVRQSKKCKDKYY